MEALPEHKFLRRSCGFIRKQMGSLCLKRGVSIGSSSIGSVEVFEQPTIRKEISRAAYKNLVCSKSLTQ